MASDNPFRRMTLRQLITHAEKNSRNVIDHLQTAVLLQVSDLHDLSRPVRRRSHYPTLLAMQNAVKKLLAAHQEVQSATDDLNVQIEEIRDRTRRERVNRM